MKKFFVFLCVVMAAISGYAQANLFDPADVDADGWLWFDTPEKIAKYVGNATDKQDRNGFDWQNYTVNPNGKPIQLAFANISPDYPESLANEAIVGTDAAGYVEGQEGYTQGQAKTGAIMLAAASAQSSMNGGCLILNLPSCSTISLYMSSEASYLGRTMMVTPGYSMAVDDSAEGADTWTGHTKVVYAKASAFSTLHGAGQFLWEGIESLNNGNNSGVTFVSENPVYFAFQNCRNVPVYIHGIKVIQSNAEQPVGVPDITFEAPAVERTFTVGLNAAGTVKVDWGDGILVEQTAAGAYDGWDNALAFTGTPSGTVKIYGEGISYFQAFTKYAAEATEITGGITAINLDGAAATLTELDLHQNNLASVDLSKLTALTSLNIGANDFATIDLSANTELTSIDLSNGKNNGKLNALDLSKNTKLTKVVLSGNKLTALDLSNNPLVKTLTVLNNALESVTFGENTNQKHTLNLGGNKLKSLDLTGFTTYSGTYLRVRDNELSEIKLPGKISQIWADGNAFTLAQLYALKSQANTLTYATTFTKEQAQQPYAIAESINVGETVDLSSQAMLGETATVFTWKKADGTALVEGTDYTVTAGVFTFLTAQEAIHCEMTNAEFPLFTAEKPYITTTMSVKGETVIEPSEPVVYDAIVGGVLAPEFAAVAGESGGVANNMVDGKSIITIQAGKATVTAVGGTTPANDPNIGGSAQQIVPDLEKVVDADKHIYEVASVGAWNDISWGLKSQGDIDFWYVTGTGNPYVGMNAVENSKDEVWQGNYKADYIYYNPDGSLGMPVTGLYYKFTASAAGAFKVKVWANKGNRQTFVVNAKTMQAERLLASGYINGVNDADGIKKFLTVAQVDSVHHSWIWGAYENAVAEGTMTPDELAEMKTTCEANEVAYQYVIGHGIRPFWGWLTFDVEAGEEYWVFQHSSQIGFGGFEFYEGKTAEELVGGEGTNPEPTDPDPEPTVAEDITVTVGAGSDIYQAVANASAGKNVGNIRVELIPGGSYTISQTIEAPAGFAIYTNGSFGADGNTVQTTQATIDASALQGPLVQMSATPAVAANEYDFYPIGDCGFINVKVTGLQQQLFYANKTKYLLDMHLVYSIILLDGSAKTNRTVFDTSYGGVIGSLDIARSTIACVTDYYTTGYLYSSQGGQKATDAGLTTQSFMINRSTIYNIACQKNFMLHRQNSQTYLNYEMKNSLFVNCGKRGVTVFGMNGGQVSGNPSWYVSGNAFNFDGEDTSADEIARDTYGKIQNVVAGVMTFNDVTSGDFGGVFTLAAGTSAPKSLGDPRWTISFAEGSAPQPVVNDRMYITEGTTLYKGKSNDLAISLYNEKTVLGCQFDMVLPNGLTISDITSSSRISSHSVTYNAQGDGSIRVVVVSTSNRQFSGNDGELLTLNLSLSEEMYSGDYYVTLKNIQLTTPDYETITPEDQSFLIHVSDVLMGDVNSDGSINVTDVVLIIDEILGKNPTNFNAVAADVNYDGSINVTDAVLVIDAILGKVTLNRAAAADGEVGTLGVTLKNGGCSTLSLNNPTAYTAFQMDVTLPMGMSLEDVILTERAKGHVVSVNQTAEGRYRVVGVSLQNNAFEGTMGDLLTLQLSGRSQGTVAIDNVVFVTPQGIQHELAGVFGEATGIGDVRGKMSDVRGDVFNLNGQRIIAPAKGLYIINGQKKVVK